MSYFEFVSVALSLIFALALADIFRSVVPAALSPARYWPHFGWLVAVFLLTIYIWLNVWGLVEIQWSGVNFLLAFVNPALMTIMARLLTTSSPDKVESFRRLFYEAKQPFFILFAFFCLFGFAFGWLVGRVPFGTITLPQYGALGGLAIAIVGLTTKSDIAHRVLVAVTIVLLLVLISAMPARI